MEFKFNKIKIKGKSGVPTPFFPSSPFVYIFQTHPTHPIRIQLRSHMKLKINNGFDDIFRKTFRVDDALKISNLFYFFIIFKSLSRVVIHLFNTGNLATTHKTFLLNPFHFPTYSLLYSFFKPSMNRWNCNKNIITSNSKEQHS
jgi:hypothetical protein